MAYHHQEDSCIALVTCSTPVAMWNHTFPLIDHLNVDERAANPRLLRAAIYVNAPRIGSRSTKSHLSPTRKCLQGSRPGWFLPRNRPRLLFCPTPLFSSSLSALTCFFFFLLAFSSTAASFRRLLRTGLGGGVVGVLPDRAPLCGLENLISRRETRLLLRRNSIRGHGRSGARLRAKRPRRA